MDDCFQDFQLGHAGEWSPPGEHFVQQCAEAEHVRPFVERPAFGLLRRHVGHGAQYCAWHRAFHRSRAVAIGINVLDPLGRITRKRYVDALRQKHEAQKSSLEPDACGIAKEEVSRQEELARVYRVSERLYFITP